MAEGVQPKLVWGKKETTSVDEQQQTQPIVSFVEIMEEQEQEEELGFYDHSQEEDLECSRDYFLALELSRDPDCSADELLALKLQREYDREMELSQKFEESRATTGKVTAVLASEPYCSRYAQQESAKEVDASSDEEEEGDDDELREFATNLLYEKRDQEYEFPPCGFLEREDGTIVTKHDCELDERKNKNKVMQLPLALSTGDVLGGGDEHRIGRRVYNELRTFGKMESKRQMRSKDKEEKATSELSVDVQTRLILLKWINSAEIDRVEGIIATGKESAVLQAVSDGGTNSMKKMGDGKNDAADDDDSNSAEEHSTSEEEGKTKPEEAKTSGLVKEEGEAAPSGGATRHYAVKVYKTTLAGFKNRAEYVKNDFRFKNPRRVMKIWAEKEFLNLKRLRRAKINCPVPVKLKKHILLMSMIGDSVPAPKLRELQWTSEQMKMDAFAQVREIMGRMYGQCHLVHGDLSEFNLLYHCGQVYVIDMAQAMDLSHPSSLRFLHRDVVNVLDFFGRIGCEQLPSAHTIFSEITGIEFDVQKDLYVQVETFERENRNMDIRDGKKHSANYELRRYNRESTCREDSPSRPYN